ncbi:MAG: ATP-binding cassette domain-containing protein [Clostridiales bacterium]|jgi:ABC-type lipoprotein export system ATPase subunit|nr:ATP-binding cassette domain-containing protein [Clostridiales bacterium]
MLRTVNLTKIYRPKKGSPVTALDSINLDLPETGLVFLLGKSGSGKSTLLNLIGGLDSITSGEIVVKGRSSKDFKSVDFDSYRNTYVGFIFQEFHILEEYTVGQNVSLALGLQNKKQDPSAVLEILKKVGLEEYMQRKPGELSGGQKQRVSIARALIKNPDLILADEPTGALDSATGEQVFDLLRGLSREKLVIVVSHDRENAERYADRIIELKDGRIIEDKSRADESAASSYAAAPYYAAPSSAFGGGYGSDSEPNYKIVDVSTVKVRRGYRLTADDIQNINYLLSNSEGVVAPFPQGFTANSRGTVFKQTEYRDTKVYSPGDFKLVKSKLPMKIGLSMGLSGLKLKKIRLAFTVFLTFIALTTFAVADVLNSYDYVTADLKSSYGLNSYVAGVTKKAQAGNDLLNSYAPSFGLSNGDISFLKETFGETYVSYSLQCRTLYDMFYSTNYSSEYNAIEFDDPDAALEFFDLQLLPQGIGRMPQNYDEIVLPDFYAKQILDAGMFPTVDEYGNPNGKYDVISKYEDLLGKSLYCYIPNNNYANATQSAKIVGIVRGKEDLAGIAALQSVPLFGSSVTQSLLLSSVASLFVKKGFFDEFPLIDKKTVTSQVGENWNSATTSKRLCSQTISEFYNETALPESSGFAPLGKKEVIVTMTFVTEFVRKQVFPDYYGGTYDPDYTLPNISEYRDVFDDEYYWIVVDVPRLIELFMRDFGNRPLPLDETYVLYNYDQNSGQSTETRETYQVDILTIKGVYDDSGSNYRSSAMYCSDAYFSGELRDLLGISFANAYVKLSGDLNADKEIVKKLAEKKETISQYSAEFQTQLELLTINNGISAAVRDLTNMLGKVLFYVSLVFMVFSGLLLMNFIGISITHKRKEIGILRAIGARNLDAFKIFFSESIAIGLASAALTCVVTLLLSISANAAMSFSLFNFGLRQVGLLFLLVLIICSVGTFVPVRRFAKKKPVDAINNR